MEITSSEAAKLLRQLKSQYDEILENERKCKLFRLTAEEKTEDVKPEYDYRSTQKTLGDLEEKIRRIKHAINTFNVTHEVPGFGMTIDQILVYLPQLNARKHKLTSMAKHLSKERMGSSYGSNGSIEYEYTNYDVDKAKDDKAACEAEIIAVQTALDTLNNSVRFEIDVEL